MCLREEVAIERVVVQGRVEDTKPQGKSPMRWIDQINAPVNGSSSIHASTSRTVSREEWRRFVKLATNPLKHVHDHSVKSDTDEEAGL